MQTSSDDDGDTSAILTKTIVLALFILPISVYKSPQKTKPLFHSVASKVEVTTVSKAPVKVKKTSKKKRLYITFDDGPNRGTKNVLHIVQDEAIPVSFFVVGEHVFASPTQSMLWDSLKMARQIELCNHSYSHAHNHYSDYYQSPDSVVKDFQRTHDSLNLGNTIARTPGRNIWRIDTLQYTDLKSSKVAADSLQRAGFILIGWDLEWHFDPKTMSITTSAEDLINQIDSLFKYNKLKNPDHLVLLAHDQVYVKPDDSLQLRLFLQLLKQRGDYEISLVSDYPGSGSRGLKD